MKITKIAAIAMTAFATAFVLPSCTEVPNPDDKPVVPQADFTVAKGDVEAEYAEVVVRHNGNQDVTWFGFVTEDVETPTDELIKNTLPSLDRANLHVGTSQTVPVRDLHEAVNYRFVAFAVDKDNVYYGTAGSLIFNTSPRFDVNFSVEMTDLHPHEASFLVSHSGHEILTYRGFVTENMDTEIEVLAASDMATIVTDGKLNEGVTLLQGKSLNVSAQELLHETAYRYIIYGIFDNDGVVISYGTPAECTFTTPIDLNVVSFSAEISNITKNSADADIHYNAKKDDLGWFAFITTDLQTSAASLIATYAPSIQASDIFNGPQKIKLEDLESETEYRYIVSGIDADGVYGMPADVRFSTLTEAYDNTVFTVTAGEITPFTATLTITHNGWDSFEYGGFLTEDLESPVEDIPVPANIDQNLMKGLETTVTLENLTALTQYRYVVVGRAFGNNYGTRGEVFFTTEDDKVEAAYADFLGKWSLASSQIVIAPKVEGSTYTVTGLFDVDELYGDVHEVEAKYDAASHTLYIMEQKLGAFNTADVPSFGSNQYGDCDDYLLGIFSYGTSTYPGYPYNTNSPARLFTAELHLGGKAVLTAGSCNYGPFVGFDYWWIIREGEYAGKGNSYHSTGDSYIYETIPATMQKIDSASSVVASHSWTVSSRAVANFSFRVK